MSTATATDTAPTLRAKDYKSEIKPIWCPGCGHFAVLSAVTKALAYLELRREEVAMISGIGCSSRLPAYVDSYGFHGVHGRALAVAAGLKAARPDLVVLVASGDGDGFSIGGNHFLHACRRNMNMTYIAMDNEVYGMTKGQASPTTEPEWNRSKLTPHGTGVPRFRPAGIALAAGASFVARGFSGDPSGLTKLLVEAIQHRGFSFLHVLSPCLTFRPEHKEWKHQVHACRLATTSNAAEAARLIQQDDGKGTGLLYVEDLPVWQPANAGNADMSTIEAEFRV
jgi:2-oxoglutarate ferredoxin oxidoreductase subunit beta